MLVRLLAGIFAVTILAASCVVPLGMRPGAQVSFVVTVPSYPAGISGAGRLVAPESTSFRVTDQSPPAADLVVTVPAVLNTVSGVSQASVTLTASLGTHTFIVEALDSSGNVLTKGQTAAITISGDQTLSLTLRPTIILAPGSNISLALSQVAYYTVPAGSSLTLTGVNSTFWELAADGSFTGAGTGGSLAVTAAAADKVVRVQQGAAGSFQVITTPATVDLLLTGLLPDEATTFKVTDQSPPTANQVSSVAATIVTVSGVRQATATVTAPTGTHTFLVEALDASLNVLSTGQTSPTVISGNQQVPLTLAPAVSLSIGNTISLAAYQVNYYTVPTGVSLRVTGTATQFWELGSDGSYSGGGPSTLDIVGEGAPKVVRALQGASAGTFSVTATPALINLVLTGLLPAETSVFRVTDMSPSAPNQTSSSVATIATVAGVRQATVTLSVPPATHTFLVEALDAGSNVLSSALTGSLVIVANQQFSLVLAAPNIVAGDTKTLVAAQVAYYTVPAGNSLTLTGATSTFWELATDGSYSGGGTPTTLTVVAGAVDKAVRVLQGAAGSFSVAQTAVGVVTINFQVPTAPVITFSALGQLELNQSPPTYATLQVNPQLSLVSSLWFIKWTIDGLDTYPDTTAFNVYTKSSIDPQEDMITVDSTKLSLGTHELVIYLTDGVHIYSANITFTVVTFPQPS